MRILVLGGGGREHAITDALKASPDVDRIYCAPGNGGTASIAENVSLAIEDGAAVATWAAQHQIDLVVIGPEGPLVAGVADSVAADGIRVFGVGKAAARLEGSKSYAKAVMARHGIPTGESRTFTELGPALDYVQEKGAPLVVKADGLAAGKGVTVAMELDEAMDAVRDSLGGRFGEAGSHVLIEEYLEGPECSLLAFTDGRTVLPMMPAQDHKRALDGDRGPNTGGMGVYSPVPVVDAGLYDQMASLLQRTIDGLAADGVPYRGVLYGGFILTKDGPKVLEYNARFGDPETQVILPRLETDLLQVMLACAEGRLSEITLEWKPEVGVSVVLASGGYPGDYETGKVIRGIDDAAAIPGVKVYHAGTKLADDGRVLTAGGRVLNVTALAHDFPSGRRLAYEAVELIRFDGMHYRTDIGRRAMEDIAPLPGPTSQMTEDL